MKPVCLITGSAGRLGTSLCGALSETHEIAAVYRTEAPRFASQLRIPINVATGKTRERYGLPFCIQGDLNNTDDVRRIVEVAMARFGHIDILINSAADTRFHGRLLEICFNSGAAENQLLTNCVAPMKLISAVFQECWKNESAENRNFNRCVINVSSVSGLYVYPNVGQAFYSASKAALNFLTMHLAYELANYSVRANSVCPSRFPDSVPTSKVVSKVKELMDSHVTGEVVEVLSR
jgi:NAD(P)-dependent dehydrogenase (short-subunit alcohol dehydrogenase family)